jgi:hypothetical protein
MLGRTSSFEPTASYLQYGGIATLASWNIRLLTFTFVYCLTWWSYVAVTLEWEIEGDLLLSDIDYPYLCEAFYLLNTDRFAHLQHQLFLRGLKMHLVLLTEAIDSGGSLCGSHVHWQHEVTGFNQDIGKAFSEVQEILNSIHSACNNFHTLKNCHHHGTCTYSWLRPSLEI